MQSLQLIRSLVSPIADISFFIKIGTSESHYSDQQIADIIKASNYQKTQHKITDFIARCDETLLGFEQRVKETEAELDSLVAKVRATKPGSPPSDFLLDRSDINAVNRYNQKVEEHNNQIDLHRRVVDQANRAKERYDDAVDRYKEKKADLEERIREKQEELKPALDRDILTFLHKTQQLVYDSIHNKEYFFEAFILIFMSKKAYLFLFDRLEESSNRRLANETFKQLNDELDVLVEERQSYIQQGLSEIVAYIHQSYLENEAILGTIQKDLENLPYEACEQNYSRVSELLSLPIETTFSYQDIINPAELSIVEQEVRHRKSEFETNIQSISVFADEIKPDFNLIAQIKSKCEANLAEMVNNKQNKLGETFADALFVLSVFNEDQQDEYLKKQKQWIEEIQLDIEQSLGVELLSKLIKNIVDTELLTKSTAETLQANPALNFLAYQQQLSQKKRKFVDAVSTLDSTLESINHLPQEQSEAFTKKSNTWLGVSILPIGNIAAIFPLQTMIKTYTPALSSNNSSYASLKKSTQKKFQNFLYAHIALTIILGGLSIPVDNQSKPLLYGVASTYAVSAGFMAVKSNQLKKLSISK